MKVKSESETKIITHLTPRTKTEQFGIKVGGKWNPSHVANKNWYITPRGSESKKWNQNLCFHLTQRTKTGQFWIKGKMKIKGWKVNMKVGIEMNEKWICAILKMKVKSHHSHLTEKVKLNSKLILKKQIPKIKSEHTGGG